MQTNKNNYNLTSVLHDAILVAIEDDIHKNSSKLSFILSKNKKSFHVHLKDISASRCTDWKFGNVVLDVNRIKSKKDTNRIIEIINYVEELSEYQISKKAYLPLYEKIENGELFIFEINPSYGAYFVAIAKTMEVS